MRCCSKRRARLPAEEELFGVQLEEASQLLVIVEVHPEVAC